MRKTNFKGEKGITLIALVITIIVLLILAGVAISMLSGENGILKRASEAKEKTEEAQKEEGGALLSYELVLNNSKYKYQYGYLTGFEYDKNEGQTVETVEDLEKELQKLSSGYKVSSKYNYTDNKDETIEKEEKESLSIATGMTITKDGQEVARTVLFGDVNCDGKINIIDGSWTKRFFSYYYNNVNELNDFQKAAMNVYEDKELNMKDYNIFVKYQPNNNETISQDGEVQIFGDKLKRHYNELQEYINLLDETTGYTFEYNDETDTYKLKGVKENTTVESLISLLPNSKEIKIVDTERQSVSTDSPVMNGYYISVNLQGDDTTLGVGFAKIEVE